MQKWLIISDSHGMDLKEILEAHKDFVIFHCGDFCCNRSILDEYGVKYVKGNCDFLLAQDTEKELQIDGYTVFITHGHKYNVKSTYTGIYYRALEVGANYCLFGHTHRESDFIEEGVHFLNPGSLKDSGSYIEIIDGNVSFKRM